MQNTLDKSPLQNFNPWLILLMLSGYVFAALLLFNIIGIIAVLPLYDFNFQLVLEVFQNPAQYPSSKIPLLIVQGITSFGSFVLIPWFVISRYFHLSIGSFFKLFPKSLIPYLLVVMATITFMGVNAIFIQWNNSLKLPETLSWFEEMVRFKEDQLGELTMFLTDFVGFGHFLLALVVVAILPAIGEELLFRGLIQNLMRKTTRNVHVAIWITSFLFAAFHMQFYGLVPRMLLGALFGYIYYWSGHLTFAMLCHFVNNGFMILMLYLSSEGIIDYDVEEIQSTPDNFALLLFFVTTALLLWYFYRFFNSQDDESVAKGF